MTGHTYHLDIGKVHQWMCTVKIGKFIQVRIHKFTSQKPKLKVSKFLFGSTVLSLHLTET